jgi:hypothetical protein
VASICLVLLATLLQPTPAEAQAEPERIVTVGDSICQAGDQFHSWRFWLRQHLTGSGANVEFVGRSTTPHQPGSSPVSYAQTYWQSNHECAWGLPAATVKNDIASRLPGNATLMLLMLGTNDLALGLPGIIDSDPAAVEQASQQLVNRIVADVEAIVTTAKNERPGLKVVVGGIPSARLLPQALVDRYNSGLSGMAGRLGVVFAPAAPIDIDTDTYDGTHLSTQGEDKVAQQFASGLARLGVGSAQYRNPYSGFIAVGGVTIAGTERTANSITLRWNPVTEAPVSNYRVWYSKIDQQTGASVWNYLASGIEGTSFTHSGIEPGETYTYAVDAWLSEGRATFKSVPVRVAPNGGSVTLESAETSPGSISLRWSASNPSLVTDYRIWMLEDGDWQPVRWGLGNTTTTYTLESLPAGTYTVAVDAALATGQATARSNPKTVTVPAPRVAGPATPTGFRIDPGMYGVSLKWDLVPGADRYWIYEWTGGDNMVRRASVERNQFWLRPLDPKRTHFYAVAAEKDGVESFRTTTLPAQAQAAPPVLSAKAGYGSIKLTWTAVADAVDYRLYRINGRGEHDLISWGPSLEHLDNFLVPGSRHVYWVEALVAGQTTANKYYQVVGAYAGGRGGFGQAVADAASSELSRFGGRHECNDVWMNIRIWEYWNALGINRHGCIDENWSAAFISWVVLEAGATRLDFAFSGSDWVYISQAFDGNGIYGDVQDIATADLAPGDLLCRAREDNEDWDYGDWVRWHARGATAVKAHCDVYVRSRSSGFRSIGGNLDNTVAYRNYARRHYDIVLKHNSATACVVDQTATDIVAIVTGNPARSIEPSDCSQGDRSTARGTVVKITAQSGPYSHIVEDGQAPGDGHWVRTSDLEIVEIPDDAENLPTTKTDILRDLTRVRTYGICAGYTFSAAASPGAEACILRDTQEDDTRVALSAKIGVSTELSFGADAGPIISNGSPDEIAGISVCLAVTGETPVVAKIGGTGVFCLSLDSNSLPTGIWTFYVGATFGVGVSTGLVFGAYLVGTYLV